MTQSAKVSVAAKASGGRAFIAPPPRSAVENQGRAGLSNAAGRQLIFAQNFRLKRGHAGHIVDPPRLEAEALEWATTRGSRLGRAAWRFIQDLAGRLRKAVEPGGSGVTPRTSVGSNDAKAIG